MGVMAHLMQVHKSITTLQGEDIVFLATDINLPGAVDWVMMQSCFGHHFMLVLEKQEKLEGHQQFFAVVQLIGSRKQAENFAYRLELNGHRRRLTWGATPRSIHEGVSSAIMNSDCLVFDTSIAQLFADNGNLGINVTISCARTWCTRCCGLSWGYPWSPRTSTPVVIFLRLRCRVYFCEETPENTWGRNTSFVSDSIYSEKSMEQPFTNNSSLVLQI